MKNEMKTSLVTHQSVYVADIMPLNKHTYQIELLAPKEALLSYQAGQYLKLQLDVNHDGKPLWLSYTISNRLNSTHPNRVFLIIQSTNVFSAKVIDYLYSVKANLEPITIMLAMGKAFLQTDLDKPHLLVAAGSGISKIKCITEEILHQNPNTTVNIYWSNRNTDDFFLLDLFHDWATQYRNLNFTTILESVHSDSDWTGRSGFIYEVIQQDFDDLKNFCVYLCGSVQMVYGTIDQLKSRGLEEANCYSDAFELA